MNFKFKKGDKVHVKYTDMLSTYFGGGLSVGPGICSEITDCRVHPDGKHQYKIKSFTGWWDECTLELA